MSLVQDFAGVPVVVDGQPEGVAIEPGMSPIIGGKWYPLTINVKTRWPGDYAEALLEIHYPGPALTLPAGLSEELEAVLSGWREPSFSVTAKSAWTKFSLHNPMPFAVLVRCGKEILEGRKGRCRPVLGHIEVWGFEDE